MSPVSRRSRSRVALIAALLLALLGAAPATAGPATAGPASRSAAPASEASAVIKPLETYEWAEVYFGTGEIGQGENLEVTVSDLLIGRQIAASFADDLVTIGDVAPADQYGDTRFTVAIPADLAPGVHSLVISTNDFDPIRIPITVVEGDSPAGSEQPTPAPTDDATANADGSQPPVTAPEIEMLTPDVPLWALGGALGGVVVIIIVTAIVRKVRRS